MGGDKTGSLLAGKPLVEYPVRALVRAGLEPFVVTKEDRPVIISGVKTVIEPPGPRHPLLGIATALRAAPGCSVLVVAGDLPLLPAQSCRASPTESRTPIRRCSGESTRKSPPSDQNETGLAAGRSVIATVSEMDPVVAEEPELARFGDPATAFFNVNTPADLAWAERHLGGGQP